MTTVTKKTPTIPPCPPAEGENEFRPLHYWVGCSGYPPEEGRDWWTVITLSEAEAIRQIKEVCERNSHPDFVFGGVWGPFPNLAEARSFENYRTGGS